MGGIVIIQGSRATVEIGDMAFGGAGIGRINKQVVFVPFAIPGDVLEVRILSAKRNYVTAQIFGIREPGPGRTQPRCPVFTRCGGCQWQMLDYPHQLQEKKRMLLGIIRHHGGVQDPVIHEPLPSPDPWHYRAKMQTVVGRDDNDRLALGFYAHASHRLVPVSTCPISHEANNLALDAALLIFQDMGWDPYDEVSGSGLARHLISRVSVAAGKLTVMPVLTKGTPDLEKVVSRFAERLEALAAVFLNINGNPGNVVIGPETRLLRGEEGLTETVRHVRLSFGPVSFFQVNPGILGKVADLVAQKACLSGTEHLLDLYCGVGTFSLFLSSSAKRVTGLDVSEEAVSFARKNAHHNGIQNARFYAGSVEKRLPSLIEKVGTAQVALVDPPRSGCDDAVIAALARTRVERVLYLSCNPVTLARDVRRFSLSGYRLSDLTPLDFFPQTAHLEVLATLVFVK
ncbi:MAG: 23S rRNA (uracil(1939)-C(5))-methyltransferase RlmD [Armatimonadetes bacterium]|nr:23S rRNA (uracil(1939)-C(5))-methyltransferase RlmD [Armatimonadota bacterium]